jgi:hypothetical protein
MNPDRDKQPKRNPWPGNLDTPVGRARRIAGMYRQHLRTLDPERCDHLDATAVSFGETWMLEREDLIDDDQELTTAESAQLVGVHPDTIRRWAATKHPDDPQRMMLARYGWRVRERTYIAGKVREAAIMARKSQLAG